MLWRSLVSALRLALPVSAAVVLLFWLFPNVAPRDPWVGFSSGMLDPGRAGTVRRSSRPAFTATFTPGSPIPRASDLYWRCEILNINDGMRWTRSLAKPARLEEETPNAPPVVWQYEIGPVPHPALPLLDRVLSVRAIRDGGVSAPESHLAGIYRLDDFAGATLQVRSGPPGTELGAPGPQELQAPRPDEKLAALANQLVRNQPDLNSALGAVRSYLADEGFVYTLRPGRQRSSRVSEFLFVHKRGFCEHYSAAAANIFRLGGVPARVVTGYRGGRWNPWLRQITVLTSDAHAWVEIWDINSREWKRFDPTDAVAPGIAGLLEMEMDTALWPWHRNLQRRLEALTQRTAEATLPWLGTAFTVVFVVLFAGGAWWGWRVSSSITPAREAARCIERLEVRLKGSSLERGPGESPLAWLGRIGRELGDDDGLACQAAAAYEAAVYSAQAPSRPAALRQMVARISRARSGFGFGRKGRSV